MTIVHFHDDDVDLPPGPRRMAAQEVAGLVESVNLDVFFKMYKDLSRQARTSRSPGSLPRNEKRMLTRLPGR